MAAKFVYFLVAFVVGSTLAQSDIGKIPELDGVTLPPELAGKLDEKDVEKIQNKSISEFRRKCEQNGGPNAFDQAQKASERLGECVKGLADPKQLQQEIEDAKPHGNVDEVFKKYCAKKPQFENCFMNFTETSKVCLSADEQKHLKTVYNVTQQLAEFICYKDGDRIALFIAEGGQECFQDKQEGLMNCFNNTGINQSNLQASLDPTSMYNFTLNFDENQCTKLFDLQQCVVNVLEGCPKPTSANIVESLFKFIRKSTPCNKFKVTSDTSKLNRADPSGSTPSAASGMFAATVTVVMAATTILLL